MWRGLHERDAASFLSSGDPSRVLVATLVGLLLAVAMVFGALRVPTDIDPWSVLGTQTAA